jgi:hypothetical protein
MIFQFFEKRADLLQHAFRERRRVFIPVATAIALQRAGQAQNRVQIGLAEE